MKHLTTAALALALAAGAAAARADQPDHPSGRQGGQHAVGQAPQGAQGQHTAATGAHGPQTFNRGGQTFAPRAGAPGGPQGGHGFSGQPGGGQGHVNEQFHGNYQGFHGNSQGGFNGQAAGAGGQNYRGYSRGPGGYAGQGGYQGGQSGHFHSGAGNASGFSGGVRGGVPGGGHQLRGRDQGRTWYHQGAMAQQFHAQRRFHADFYNRPHGWYARRWGFGEFLPWGWFAPSYYLDYEDYDLPVPPIGCEWVREGPDAVLVNVWTGEVLSVDYGVFW